MTHLARVAVLWSWQRSSATCCLVSLSQLWSGLRRAYFLQAPNRRPSCRYHPPTILLKKSFNMTGHWFLIPPHCPLSGQRTSLAKNLEEAFLFPPDYYVVWEYELIFMWPKPLQLLVACHLPDFSSRRVATVSSSRGNLKQFPAQQSLFATCCEKIGDPLTKGILHYEGVEQLSTKGGNKTPLSLSITPLSGGGAGFHSMEARHRSRY